MIILYYYLNFYAISRHNGKPSATNYLVHKHYSTSVKGHFEIVSFNRTSYCGTCCSKSCKK